MAESNRGVAVVLVDDDGHRPVPGRPAGAGIQARRHAPGMTAGMTGHLLVRTATGPVDAVGRRARLEVDRQPGARLRGARRRPIDRSRDVPDGDDTAALRRVPRPARDRGRARPPRRAVVDGRGGTLLPGPPTLPARLAGTTSRFVTALAALGPVRTSSTATRRCGHGRWARCTTRSCSSASSVTPARGDWVGSRSRSPGRRPVDGSPIRGDISSQFVTALMLIGPCLPRRPADRPRRARSCRGRTSR